VIPFIHLKDLLEDDSEKYHRTEKILIIILPLNVTTFPVNFFLSKVDWPLSKDGERLSVGWSVVKKKILEKRKRSFFIICLPCGAFQSYHYGFDRTASYSGFE
jgi:hypothetical protein